MGDDCLLFDEPSCAYAAILGRDFLVLAGIDICYSDQTMKWCGRVVPMKSKAEPFALYIDLNDEDDLDDLFLTQEIRERKYEKVDLDTVVAQQTHLSESQREALRRALEGHEQLFNGKLGKYPHRQVHLDLKEGAQPVHCRPFPIPRAHEQVFKNECAELCKDGVLEPIGASEHAYPTFITPKKDGRVRWVSDFRKLNLQLKRHVYPLPKIQDILHRRKGYKYLTKIDISMQYYTFELDDESKKLCVIVTPFGKFQYNRLPMGIKTSPDFAQEIMEEVLRGLDFSEVYLDDIAVFTDGSFEEHCRDVHLVLTRLQENGFTVNPLKCEWAVQETDWLGYWLTPKGLKPWKKKIDGILKLKPPTTLKGLRSLIGMVNYYRDMWPRRSHILAPLTDLTGTTKFVWEDVHQRAFEHLMKMMQVDAFLAYPDPNKPFHIFTDASDYQLGAVIMQDGKPVAYYTRKLNRAQKNYSTIEKELLSMVATLKEFRSMLLGADIHIHTDHSNLTQFNFSSQRVIRWRLYLEEFTPTFHFIKGEENVLADFLSRSNLADGDEDAELPPSKIEIKETDKERTIQLLPSEDELLDPVESFMITDPDVYLECYLNEPHSQTTINPVD